MMKKLLPIILLLFFSLLALWPFFQEGFFKTHDGEWMIIRFSAFHQELRAGQLPVRFLDRLNNGYGYPVSNFLYPLPFYAAEIPKIIGFSFTNSIKIIFVASTIVSVLAMYWALKKRYSTLASFVGAVLYLYLPYRFIDLYVRGSLGENLAFVFLPIILGAFFEIQRGKKLYYPILSLGIGLLVISHNVIAFMFIALFSLITMAFEKAARKILLFVFLGLLTGAFFWIPALFDLQYVKLSQIKVSEISSHLVVIQQILIPRWGYGPDPNAPDGLSVQVGLVSIFLFLASLVAITFSKIRDRLVLTFVVIYPLIIFFMSKYSEFIWKNVPNLDVVQFPWRMLSLIVLVSAVFAAFIIDYSRNRKAVATLLTLAAISSTFLYTQPREFSNQPDSLYATNESTTTVRDEYMPLWVKKTPEARPATKIQTSDASVSELRLEPSHYRAKLTSEKNLTITVNTIYFPGWQVKSNNIDIPIKYQNDLGLIMFELPKGEHDVIIKYNKTPVHLLSEILSVAALLVTGFFFLKWTKR